MSKKLNDAALDALAEAFGEPPEDAEAKLDLDWKPKLNPIQDKAYLTKSNYVLQYGERGSGKTIGAIHKLVKHCVHNRNALGFIVVKETGHASDGGAWSKLIQEVLPAWKHGNLLDRKTGERDGGMGVDYTVPKMDNITKKMYIWVQNKFGGWSQVMLISLFVGEHVEDKVKGKEPSFIVVDEAQTTNSIDYYTKLGQQLGRRQDIDPENPPQLVYCANPKGPSHWLYEVFLEDPIDFDTGHPFDLETGELNDKKSVFHVPASENLHNLPPGYWEAIQELCRVDPIEEARMIRGEWIDKPDGDALFKDQWVSAFHVRGDAGKNKGIHPIKGLPLVLGYDLGSAHSSVHILQRIPTLHKVYWMVIDELNFVGQYMPYLKLVPKLIDRLMYWEEACGAYAFTYRHISDNSAFNQFRAASGSFDVQDVEKYSKEYVARKNLPERFVIRLEECPKGKHSVAARVRVIKEHMFDTSFMVSATCGKTIDMFLSLEEDRNNRENPKRSKHLHSFDSLSYPILFFSAVKTDLSLRTDKVKPEFYRVGG